MSNLKRPRPLNEESGSSWWYIPITVLVVLIALFAAIDAYIGATCFGVYVSGDSMYATVEDGDFVYARDREAKRGDVIIINVQNYRDEDHLSGDFIIKRLIAIEGDSVYCQNGTVYRKCAGETEYTPLVEDYARELTTDFREVQVGEGEIFFLGDNRLISLDSRKLGCYKQSDITGVVPEWAIKWKNVTTGWENFRSSVAGIFG